MFALHSKVVQNVAAAVGSIHCTKRTSDLMHQVSRAVSSLDLVGPYYLELLGGSLVHTQHFPGTGQNLMVVNAPQSSVHLQFWEGVQTTG